MALDYGFNTYLSFMAIVRQASVTALTSKARACACTGFVWPSSMINWTDNHTWNVRSGHNLQKGVAGIYNSVSYSEKKTISVMIFNPCNVVIKRRSQTVCAVITPKTLQEDDEWLIPILSISVISKVAMFKICRLPFSVSCCMRTEITTGIIKYGPLVFKCIFLSSY